MDRRSFLRWLIAPVLVPLAVLFESETLAALSWKQAKTEQRIDKLEEGQVRNTWHIAHLYSATGRRQRQYTEPPLLNDEEEKAI